MQKAKPFQKSKAVAPIAGRQCLKRESAVASIQRQELLQESRSHTLPTPRRVNHQLEKADLTAVLIAQGGLCQADELIVLDGNPEILPAFIVRALHEVCPLGRRNRPDIDIPCGRCFVQADNGVGIIRSKATYQKIRHRVQHTPKVADFYLTSRVLAAEIFSTSTASPAHSLPAMWSSQQDSDNGSGRAALISARLP